jgi:hypothetical protein
MTSLVNLIKRNKANVARRIYIKRRDLTGTYEGSWVRVDNYGNKQRVIDWGSAFTAIDSDPQIIGSFDVSGIDFVMENSEGLFNVESYYYSIWYPESDYLNRRYTKIKLETGYIDDDGTEVGTATDFEGYIDSVELSENYTASLHCLSYQGILQRYPITDLSLTGSKTVNEIVTAIMNQAKITVYLPYNAPSATNNFTVADSSTLQGTYWDILTELAFKSNSIIYLHGSDFYFKERTAGAVVWNFKGTNSLEPQDIYQINSYDDEGAGRVRVYFKADDEAYTAVTSDSTLALKYKADPEIVDVSFADSGDRQGILNELLAEFEDPKPYINFDCKFLLNQIKPLDKITVEVRGQQQPGPDAGGFIWGAWTWGDGSVWGREIGGIVISSGTEWKVTDVLKDFHSYKMTISAEKVA